MMDPVGEVLNDHDGIRSCMECSACLFFLVLISDLWPLRRMCRAFCVSPTYCFLIFACSLRNPYLLSSPKSLMLVPQCHLIFQSEMACTCMYMYTLHCVVLMESVTPYSVHFFDFSITLWPHPDLHAFYTAGSRFTLRYQFLLLFQTNKYCSRTNIHIELVSLLLLILLRIPLTPPPTPPPTPSASQPPTAPSLPARRQRFLVWNPSSLPPSQAHIQMEVG